MTPQQDGPTIKGFMLLCFGIGALWDGLTTIFGLAAIIKAHDVFGYAMCAVGGVVVLGFGVGTKVIFSKDEMPFPLLKAMWGLALAFDVYTSFMGSAQYIVLGKQYEGPVEVIQALTSGQFGVVLCLTAFVSASPVLISYLYQDE